MSQNPYATYGNTTDLAPPARTSVLAVLSLVSSLICCIPGLSIIGTLLGSIAILRISSSNGRRKGVGLAIAGIVIGLIVSFCYIGGYLAISSGIKQMMGVGSTLVSNLKSPDITELRKTLPPEKAALLTDAQWKSFKDQIEAEIGTPGELPTNPISYFSEVMDAFSKFGQAAGRTGRQPRMNTNVPPIPLKGSNGVGVMMIELTGDPTPDTNHNLSILRQVSIYTGSGKIIQLFPGDTVEIPSPSPGGSSPPPLPPGSGGGQNPSNPGG